MRPNQPGFPETPQHQKRLKSFIGRVLRPSKDIQATAEEYSPLAVIMELSIGATADGVDAKTLKALLGIALQWIVTHHQAEVLETMRQAKREALH